MEVKGLSSRFLSGHNKRGSKESLKTIKKRKENWIKKLGNIDTSPKLCKCGCGKYTSNWRKLYIHGHHRRNTKVKEESKKKKIETFLKNFGVINPMKLDSIKEKIQNTSKEKYGVYSTNQVESIKEKKNQTWLNHTIQQNKEIKEKTKQTSINRHNGIGFSSFNLAQKTKDSIQNKYGVDNYSKTNQFRQFAREQMIYLIMLNYKDGQTFTPTIGKQEKECLDELQKICSFQILRNQQIIGLFPDGYIKELNIVVEFYENWHDRICFQQHDIRRQNELIDHLHCEFFIIHEKNWRENKDQVINDFKNLLSQLSEQN
jgi:hypothetical protein